jgi:hypothetical protein
MSNVRCMPPAVDLDYNLTATVLNPKRHRYTNGRSPT